MRTGPPLPTRRRLVLTTGLVCALAAFATLAYDEAVHAVLTGHAFAARAAWLATPVAPATPQDLDAFRRLFWRTASTLPPVSGAADGDALRTEFVARFPSEDSFDAWEFKEFFMLDPAATVHGFDTTPSPALEGGRLARGALLEDASRWPDDDQRNRHRYLHDAQRAVVRDSRGEPLPDDPATLEMGGLTGPTSQGHAHYGLLPGPLSDDPEVLKKDPRHFAIPPDVHTFGAEFAQLYTDLALLARGSNLPGAEWLTWTFAGAAFHHIEDLANQIHTVQVGIYDFFQAAWVQSKVRDLVTLGGLFGERWPLKKLGLRLVANHHLLSEGLFAKRVEEAERGEETAPEVQAAIAGIASDDESFARQARAAVAKSDGAFGSAIAGAMIETSSREGPEVYRLIWKLSLPPLRDGHGHEFDDKKDDPDQWVIADSPARRDLLSRFYELEGRGLRRAGTALRLWEQLFEAAAASDPQSVRVESVRRTLAFLLPYHRAQEQRRAAFVPPPPEHGTIDWRFSAAAALIVALIILLMLRSRRRPTL